MAWLSGTRFGEDPGLTNCPEEVKWEMKGNTDEVAHLAQLGDSKAVRRCHGRSHYTGNSVGLSGGRSHLLEQDDNCEAIRQVYQGKIQEMNRPRGAEPGCSLITTPHRAG